jgi:hypothetical protein
MIFYCVSSTFAQEKKSKDVFKKAMWSSLSFGTGAGQPDENLLAVIWSANYQRHHLLISIRNLEGVSALSFFLLPFSLFTSFNDEDRVSEIAFMVGWANQNRGSHLSITGGLAIVQLSTLAIGDQNESKIVLGFPVEGKFFGKLGDHFGIGIGAYGNINSEWSFGGVTVGLHFGRLR